MIIQVLVVSIHDWVLWPLIVDIFSRFDPEMTSAESKNCTGLKYIPTNGKKNTASKVPLNTVFSSVEMFCSAVQLIKSFFSEHILVWKGFQGFHAGMWKGRGLPKHSRTYGNELTDVKLYLTQKKGQLCNLTKTVEIFKKCLWGRKAGNEESPR